MAKPAKPKDHMTKDSGGSQGDQRCGVPEEEQPLANHMGPARPSHTGGKKQGRRGNTASSYTPSACIEPLSTFYSITLPTHVRWTPSPGREAKAGFGRKAALLTALVPTCIPIPRKSVCM